MQGHVTPLSPMSQNELPRISYIGSNQQKPTYSNVKFTQPTQSLESVMSRRGFPKSRHDWYNSGQVEKVDGKNAQPTTCQMRIANF